VPAKEGRDSNEVEDDEMTLKIQEMMAEFNQFEASPDLSPFGDFLEMAEVTVSVEDVNDVQPTFDEEQKKRLPENSVPSSPREMKF